MNLQLITEAHCQAGRVTYEARGYLIPKFWAQGSTVRVIAEPMNTDGMALDVVRGVVLLTYLCDLAQARYFGRTAEAWSKTHHDGDMVPAEGLASIADIDPEVHTSIVAQGFDMLTNKTHLTMTTFDLDDDAQPIWRHRSETGPTGQFDIVALSVRSFFQSPRELLTPHQIDLFVDDCGWRLTILDD